MRPTDRILKNTAFMYIALVITVITGLYTSRLVITNLGVVDYGIYSLLGGLVLLFAIISGSMAGSVQRYLTVAIGQGDDRETSRVFSASVVIHLLFAAAIFILGVTIGRWFLENFLNIPPERQDAASWVFHFVLISFALKVITVPAQAMLNAFEVMGTLAFTTLIPTFGKLVAALALPLVGSDSLKTFSFLICCVAIVEVIAIYTVTKMKIRSCKLVRVAETKLYFDLLSFASWGLIGEISHSLKVQGVPIILNIFFGPVANAAYGIAGQVKHQLTTMAQIIIKTTNPQIIKNYSTGYKEKCFTLVFQASKICFGLLFIVTIPLLLETDLILTFWLNEVPPLAITFTRLVIIVTLVEAVSFSLITLSRATGKIILYQSTVGGLLLLNLPVSYILLNNGMPPETVYFVNIIIAVIALFARLPILKKTADLPVKSYCKNVLLNCAILFLLTGAGAFLINTQFEVTSMHINMFYIPLLSGCCALFIILKGSERNYLINLIKARGNNG
ncbi:hypothetical protein QA601_06410 [Chitinispirillales bacterium ANBcel5]|uniref:lipopolysaccharide biosynthesis protein n=1 Tax=Cellulosispirillum alkaliphilum TaxID=3039283 RepID=UPI002A56D153|nr:hypothetical protein [Chitinispirillales bacterium ANBcel5]